MIEKIELRVTCDLLKVTKLLNSRTRVRCRFYDTDKLTENLLRGPTVPLGHLRLESATQLSTAGIPH